VPQTQKYHGEQGYKESRTRIEIWEYDNNNSNNNNNTNKEMKNILM
jgi:hypothetical protein